MDLEQERKILKLLEKALALEGKKRLAYLAEACAGNRDLFRQVKNHLRLVEDDDRLDRELGRIVGQEADRLLTSGSEEGNDPLPPGTMLAHYRLGKVLGAGGMGTVYQAEDTKLKRLVAIKVLSRKLAADPSYIARFKREGKAAAALNHPHIVTIHSIDETQKLHYLTMELVEGFPLQQVIGQQGLPLDRFLNIAIQLTQALDAAHAGGIVHRDLKPANIMLGPGDQVKILDFGLAKQGWSPNAHKSTATTVPLTQPGGLLGTIPYMSPELLKGMRPDHRTDLFSLGVIFCEMLTGKRPFAGNSSCEMISAILRDPPMSVSAHHPNIPLDLDSLVQACLAKIPSSRPADAGAILNELLKIRQRKEWETTLSFEPPKTGFTWPKVTRPLVVAGLLAVLLLMVGPCYLTRRPAPFTDFQIPSKETWIFMADFQNNTHDPFYNEVVHDLLERSLHFSKKIRVIRKSEIRDRLSLMRIDPKAEIKQKHLQEACVREKIPLMITGQVNPLENGFVVETQVLENEGFKVRGVYRQTFSGTADLTPAIGKLGNQLRTQLTEEAHDRDSKSLPMVTTANLEALEHYASALDFAAMGENNKAETALESAVAIDPKFAMAHARRASLLSALGRREEALTSAARAFALKEIVSDREQLLIEGHYHMARCEYALAEVAFIKHNLLYPNDGYVLRQRSHCQSILGKLGDAVKTMKDARDTPPADVINHGMVLVAMAEAGQNREALREAHRVHARFPDFHYPYWGEGLALLGLLKTKRAQRCFIRLAEGGGIYRSHSELLQAKTMVLEGKLEEASRLLVRGLEQDAEYDETFAYRKIWLARLENLYGSGEIAAAHLAFSLDLEPLPANINYLRLAALAYLEMGMMEESRLLLEKLEHLAPRYRGNWIAGSVDTVRGAYALEQNRMRDAARVLNRAAETRRDPHTLWWLARLQVKKEQWRGAADTYRELIERKGQVFRNNFPDIWVAALWWLAECETKLNRQKEAAKYRRQFLDKWGESGRGWVLKR